MNLSPHFRRYAALLCLAAAPAVALAQRPLSNMSTAKSAPGTYNIANDVSLQGTILTYDENSKTPPLGTHVVLQTPSGSVEVHLGDARLLHLAKLNLTPGMSVRFVGQSSTQGQSTIFLARLAQVGAQVVAVRSEHGLPLAPAGIRGNKSLAANVSADQQGGAR